MKHAATTLLFITLLAALPNAHAAVTLGGAGGNVTLTNPDGSYYLFTQSNATTYQHVHNMPDGWWVFNPPTPLESAEYWVVGVVFGLMAFAVAVVALVRRKQE